MLAPALFEFSQQVGRHALQQPRIAQVAAYELFAVRNAEKRLHPPLAVERGERPSKFGCGIRARLVLHRSLPVFLGRGFHGSFVAYNHYGDWH